MFVEDVGEISILGNQVQWKILDFFNLQQSEDVTITSRIFVFEDDELCLGIWPNGYKFDSTQGWFGLNLRHKNENHQKFRIRLGIVDNQGEEIRRSCARWNSGQRYYFEDKFMYRTQLESRRTEIAPDGHLRIICDIRPLREDYTVEVSTQTEAECGLDKLYQNLKDLYLESKDSDLTIRVKDRDFRAHRCILRARTPVFEAMLSHNMAENNSGVISIDDCDPEIFGDFLLFLYTGWVEYLSNSNACGLYYAADKYDLPELKAICVQFLQRSLSIETVFDVLCLAMKHREVKLQELATQFFARNLEEILVTVKWELFLEENSVQANELIKKALKFGYTRKTT